MGFAICRMRKVREGGDGEGEGKMALYDCGNGVL